MKSLGVLWLNIWLMLEVVISLRLESDEVIISRFQPEAVIKDDKKTVVFILPLYLCLTYKDDTLMLSPVGRSHDAIKTRQAVQSKHHRIHICFGCSLEKLYNQFFISSSPCLFLFLSFPNVDLFFLFFFHFSNFYLFPFH